MLYAFIQQSISYTLFYPSTFSLEYDFFTSELLTGLQKITCLSFLSAKRYPAYSPSNCNGETSPLIKEYLPTQESIETNIIYCAVALFIMIWEAKLMKLAQDCVVGIACMAVTLSKVDLLGKVELSKQVTQGIIQIVTPAGCTAIYAFSPVIYTQRAFKFYPENSPQ